MVGYFADILGHNPGETRSLGRKVGLGAANTTLHTPLPLGTAAPHDTHLIAIHYDPRRRSQAHAVPSPHASRAGVTTEHPKLSSGEFHSTPLIYYDNKTYTCQVFTGES